MATQVSVTHDGWEHTTNTSDEATLRASIGSSDAAGVEEEQAEATSGAAPVPPVPASVASDLPVEESAVETTEDQRQPTHKRIAKLTAKFRDAERAAQAAQAEREKLAREVEELRQARSNPASPTSQQAPTPAPARFEAPAEDPEPVFETFANEPEKYPDPYAAWMKATARWEGRQAYREEQAKAKREAEAREWEAHRQAHISRTEAFAAKHPEYHQLKDAPVAASPVMQHAIVVSERGPEIALYLAKHQDEATGLQQQTAHLGPESMPLVKRMLETLIRPSAAAPVAVQPAAVTRTHAPAPIQPIGAAPVVTDDPPTTDDLDAHVAYWDRKKPVSELLRRR